MQVLKFGGTSVATADSIKQVAAIVKNAYNAQGEKIIVVVSAMSGITNQLIQIAKTAEQGDDSFYETIKLIETHCFDVIKLLFPSTLQSSISAEIKTYLNELENTCQGVMLIQDLSPKTLDKIMSYGELVSSKIITAYFNAQTLNCTWLDSRQLIKTDSSFGFANINLPQTYTNIQKAIAQHTDVDLFLAPGFIASNADNHITTLGRGGSDYSASIYAVAVQSSLLEIWTDVSGMMTADPRLVKHAKYIKELDYPTALELCHFGAKIIFPPTLETVMQKNIPIMLKNTFAPSEAGTHISASVDKLRIGNYTGICSVQEVGILSMRGNGTIKLTNIINRIFKVFAEAQIPVLLTTQGSSEHFVSIALSAQHIFDALHLVEQEFEEDITHQKVASPQVETDLSIVALVGDNMRNQPGTAARMFAALGRNGINIRAMAQGTSERNMSTIINRKDVKKANLILHEEFFEEKFKMLHLFIVGVGNVGSKLLQQLQSQKETLKQSLGLHLRVVGLANSKKMLFDERGIKLEGWEEQLNDSNEAMEIDNFIRKIGDLNLRNSVFVDVTAHEEVALQYDKILQRSVSIVACNKIACSVDYSYYQSIKKLASKHNVSLMFETNVGAGLPIIDTLSGLIRSGDSVERIEAVLSGTLNFVFNNYDGTKSFASVVKQAKEEGYTEPDPRIDLSGKDVARKILILAREAGKVLDIGEIKVNEFLPSSVMEASVDNIYSELEKHEAHFKQLLEAAKAENCILKYVATYENGKAHIGLKHIAPESDMYHLYNKDNIVLFYTKRYNDQPLVVKGAGAGADVTAAGIFADILKTRY